MHDYDTLFRLESLETAFVLVRLYQVPQDVDADDFVRTTTYATNSQNPVDLSSVLLFRIAENKRKRPPSGSPELVRYASCFAAMLMGRYLLQDLATPLERLDHRVFRSGRGL